jgi:hypothetical protein
VVKYHNTTVCPKDDLRKVIDHQGAIFAPFSDPMVFTDDHLLNFLDEGVL